MAGRLGYRLASLVRWACIALALVVIGGSAIASVFGYRLMLVTSGSMVPTFQPRDAVIVHATGGAGVRAGDVITFRPYSTDHLITHRVLSVRSVDGKPCFQTKGDANPTPDDNLVPAGSVYGRQVFTIPRVGPQLLTALTPKGKLALLGFPILFVLVQQLTVVARGLRAHRLATAR